MNLTKGIKIIIHLEWIIELEREGAIGRALSFFHLQRKKVPKSPTHYSWWVSTCQGQLTMWHYTHQRSRKGELTYCPSSPWHMTIFLKCSRRNLQLSYPEFQPLLPCSSSCGNQQKPNRFTYQECRLSGLWHQQVLLGDSNHGLVLHKIMRH